MTSPRVLIVDDREDNLNFISDVFEAAGAKTHSTDNPEEALKMVQYATEPFDMIVTDIHMPEMDGQEFAKKLRDGGFEKAIIAFTAHPTMGARSKGQESGITRYIGKPLIKTDLIRALLDEYCS